MLFTNIDNHMNKIPSYLHHPLTSAKIHLRKKRNTQPINRRCGTTTNRLSDTKTTQVSKGRLPHLTSHRSKLSQSKKIESISTSTPWHRITVGIGLCLSVIGYCAVRHLMDGQNNIPCTPPPSLLQVTTCPLDLKEKMDTLREKNLMVDLGDLLVKYQSEAEALDAYAKGAEEGNHNSKYQYNLLAEKLGISQEDQQKVTTRYREMLLRLSRQNEEQKIYSSYMYSLSQPTCSSKAADDIRYFSKKILNSNKKDALENPAKAIAYFNIGKILSENNNNEEALEAYAKAIAEGHDEAIIPYFKLAKKLNIDIEKIAQVFDTYSSRLIKTFSNLKNDKSKLTTYELFRLGQINYKNKKYLNALAFFTEGLKAGDRNCMAEILNLQAGDPNSTPEILNFRIDIPHIKVLQTQYIDILLKSINLQLESIDLINTDENWIERANLCKDLMLVKDLLGEEKAVPFIPDLKCPLMYPSKIPNLLKTQ